MVDWMIQVTRVMKIASHSTLAMAVSIMDRYLAAKAKEQVNVNSEDLHLIGVVAIFISSKFEDVKPIFLSKLLHKIANDAFTKA